MGKLTDAFEKMKKRRESGATDAPPAVPPPPPLPPEPTFPTSITSTVTFHPAPPAPPVRRQHRVNANVAQGAVTWVGNMFCCVCGRHTGKPKDTDFSVLKRTRSKKHCTGCADPANCEACSPAPSQAGRNVSVQCIDTNCGARWTVTRETLRRAGVTFVNI